MEVHKRLSQRYRKILLLTAAVSAMAAADSAFAANLPTGGAFASGGGHIAITGPAMTINQSTHDAIINWQGFSIGAANKVQFNNGNGATLNRVLGNNLSEIEGQLGATGSVYLINAQGVVIGPGGKVLTGGDFVASSRDISNENFLQGGALVFSGNSPGTVVNQGQIVSVDGSVVLVGQAVSNSGSIRAAQGTVGMAAGNTVLLQPVGGDQRVFVTMGTGDVTNSGQIKAAATELRAANGNVYALAGNTQGLIEATGSKVIDGQVWLTSNRGSVTVGGTVTAQNSNGTGGGVTATGKQVTLANGATIAANGSTGGTVKLIATGTTTVDGSILAMGQSQGGYVDTSGQQVVIGATAKVSTAAANGTFGNWLIDPTDYTIAPSGGNIAGAQLSSDLAGGNITILSSQGSSGTSGNINVDDTVSWSANTTLTLSAYANINVNGNITATGNTAGLVLTPNTGAAGGTVNFNGGAITLSGSNPMLTIAGNNYTVLNTATVLEGMGSTGYYALGSNIDLSSIANFTPIGESTAFSGTFNGLGHTISNLTINTSTFAFAGLFGQTASGSSIANVGLVGDSVTDTGNNSLVGALVGYNSGGTITNVYATGNVIVSANGNYIYVGGLVGSSTGGTITNAYATGNVSVSSIYSNIEIGGLVGNNGSGTITNAYATGSVHVSGASGVNVGGLVGNNGGTVTNAYATGSVTGSVTGSGNYVGGLVGYNDGGTVIFGYATGGVSGSGSGSDIGGLVGYNGSSITDGYWDSTIAGSTGIGGGTGTATGVTGLTTSQMFTLANFTGFTASTTPGATGNAWVVVDLDGSLNNAGGVAGGTLPMLTSEWSTTISNAHQLQLMVLAPTATYTLASDINASGTGAATSSLQPDVWGTSGFVPVGGGIAFTGYSGTNGFSGTLNGQGHVISSLTVNNTVNYGLGLFSSVVSGGVVENVGLVGGSISGTHDTGTLVGDLGVATLNDVFSTATVNSSGGSVGGLAGFSVGTITNAYTTGNVTGTGGANGGIVGRNGNGSNTPAISDVYATGVITGTSGSYDGGVVGWNDGGVVTDGYWDTTTSGATAGIGAGITTGAVGLATTQLSSALPTGFSGSVWGNVNNQTTPYLLVFGTVQQQVYVGADTFLSTLIYTTAQLQAVNNNLAGHYALANDLDVSSISNFTAIGESTAFSGTFNGLGHTISNLTINTSTLNYAGLFGQITSGSSIENVGLVGASVTATGNGSMVGALLGYNDGGSVTDAYSTGNVSGGNNSVVGGLVGYNKAGSITDVYTTGYVNSGGGYVGGLVGANSGTIANAYSTSEVSGGSNSMVGGLAGFNYNGTITNAYATGHVSGSIYSDVGGLVGYNYIGGVITNGYWDITTAGATAGIGGGTITGATGLTASQMMQQSNFTGFDFTTPVWVIYNGHTMPLLNAFLTPLTITAGDIVQGYNGTVPASLSSPTYSVAAATTSGNLFGLTAPYSGDANVGTYSPQIWSDQQGYHITFTGGTLTVNPAVINLGGTRNYDSTTIAAASTFGSSGTISTGINSETLVLSGSGTLSSANVGSPTLTLNTLTLSNGTGLANNYTLTGGTDTYTINPYQLSITGVTANNKVYDGTTTATLTSIGTLSATVGGQTLTLHGPTAVNYSQADVGNNLTVTASGYSLANGTGSNAGLASNYTLNGITSAATTANITPAILTITGVTANNKVYDGTTTATLNSSGAALGGLVAADVGHVSLASGTGVFATSNVGNNIAVTVTGLNLSGADAGDYILPTANYPRGLTADITAPFPVVPLNASLIGYWFTPYYSSVMDNAEESQNQNKVTVPAMSDRVLSNPITTRSFGNRVFIYEKVEGRLMLIDSILLSNHHNGKSQGTTIAITRDEVVRLLAGGGGGNLQLKPRIVSPHGH